MLNYNKPKGQRYILKDKNLIALRYCNPSGEVNIDSNPNGSIENIAGVFSSNKRVLGMMPHPERLADIKLGGIEGLKFFEGLLEGFS